MTALDELIADYVEYWNGNLDALPLRFTDWCNDPVECDQELLAESRLAEFVF